MFTIGTAAYKLYSASSQVGSTLSTLSNYHRYVTEAIFNSPSEVENLHPLVKQNLDRLARRIQVLSSPLNYCLLWSQHRGSAVAETIHQSKEVLKQTYHWLHECNKDKTKLSDKEYMLKKLDEHIREIDFCLQALNLALSIIQTTTNDTNNNQHPTQRNRSISPSCLLTASNRIMAMHNSGGDVAICFGQLFKKSLIDNNNTNWGRIYRRCALKIYRNGIRKSYELRIECNEYGYDSDEEDIHYNLNEAYPLTLKFELTSSIYFTTLSSLIIDLPCYGGGNKTFTKTNLNMHNLNRNELIEDAFGWVNMLANQVQQQYIFVLKSGLDDWDKPLSSDDNNIPQPQVHKQKQTSVIFLKQEEVEEHIDVSDNEQGNDGMVTASIASLNTAVIEARKRTHLGSLLAPGGDYDESHVTPQLMAYMTRLAIYENDYTKPQTVQHTNSSFKKYNVSATNNESENEQKIDLKMNESALNGVIISSSLTEQTSNASNSSSSPSVTNSSVPISDGEYDTISNDDYKIKQQQKIPAHLNASDEELHLFLRNPPTPPIPFYPTNIHFTNTPNAPNTQHKYRRFNTRKTRKSPHKNKKSDAKKAYFAAPNDSNEVTVIYPDNVNHKKRKKVSEIAIAEVEDTYLLSISDENHMKYLSPESKKSMAAIKDATKSSLLDDVDVTASQTLSALNTPRNIDEAEEDILHGNFANLSIDNGD